MEMNEVNSSSREWAQKEDHYYYPSSYNISEELYSDFNYNLTSTASKAHSRVRREVPYFLVNGYDPLEIIQAYHEDVDQLMIVTIIIFLLVVLVLPLLFTVEFLHNSGHEKVDAEPRGSKVALEEDDVRNMNVVPDPDIVPDPDRDAKNQNRRQFIQTANQSTQLALEDGDDLMTLLDPEELEFTVIARPRRYSVDQQSRPYEPSHLNLKTKPSHLRLSHQADENTVAPLLFEVPSTLQRPNQMEQPAPPPEPEPADYEVVTPPRKKSKAEKQSRPPEPEPLKLIKVEEEQQTQQVDPKLSKSAAAYQVVQPPTTEITQSLPHIVDGKAKGPVMKSRYKPTDPNLKIMTVPKPPEVDSEHVSTQTSRTKLKTVEIIKSHVKPKKKCRDKVQKEDTSGNSSKCVEQRAQDPCACPSGFIHTKFKDLSWGQVIQYAMADGGWYYGAEASTTVPVVDNQMQNTISSVKGSESTVTIAPWAAKKEGEDRSVGQKSSQGRTDSKVSTDEGNRNDKQETDKPTPIPTFSAGADRLQIYPAPAASSSTPGSQNRRDEEAQGKQAKSKTTRSRSSASQ